jgi:hypothetical protein
VHHPFWPDEETNKALKKILTEANLYQPEMAQDVDIFIEKIDDMLRVGDFEVGPTAELVLEPMLSSKGDEMICGYYFVDHEKRCLFWLEDFDASFLLREVKGATSPAHIRFELEAQYWLVSFSFIYAEGLTPPF